MLKSKPSFAIDVFPQLVVSLENSASGYAPGPGPGYAPGQLHRKPGPWTTGRNLATLIISCPTKSHSNLAREIYKFGFTLSTRSNFLQNSKLGSTGCGLDAVWMWSGCGLNAVWMRSGCVNALMLKIYIHWHR